MSVPPRAKAEPYDQQMLLIVRMVKLDEPSQIGMGQGSIVLGNNDVLTFQERSGDVLDPVRRRIRSGKGPIQRSLSKSR